MVYGYSPVFTFMHLTIDIVDASYVMFIAVAAMLFLKLFKDFI